MPADPSRLRFYADENILGVAKALARVREDLVHPGHPLLPEVPLGTDDTLWMPEVAKRQLVVLGRDKHIKSKPAELAAFHAQGLRAFWLSGKKDLTSWGKLVRFVMRWEDIEEQISIRGGGPWFMAINERDVVDIPLHPAKKVRTATTDTPPATPGGAVASPEFDFGPEWQKRR